MMNRCVTCFKRMSILSISTLAFFANLNSVTAADSGRDALWGIPQPTHYLTISRPTKKLHDKHAPPSFTVSPQSPQPYAYGWFGQKTTPSLYRHFGHQQNYTQWTFR
jgi:hypothetical protein